MSHVLCEVLLFLAIVIHFVLNLIYLTLNVVEAPLLRLLHLNHHLLNLFELLEAICLHFFKLFLLCNKHSQTITLPKKCMLNNSSAVLNCLGVVNFKARVHVMHPVLVKVVKLSTILALSYLLLRLLVSSCDYVLLLHVLLLLGISYLSVCNVSYHLLSLLHVFKNRRKCCRRWLFPCS